MSSNPSQEKDAAAATRRERSAARRERRTRRARRAALAVAAVLALVLGIGLAAGWRLDRNIARVDVEEGLGDRPSRDDGPDGPLNVLVIGSDARQGIGTDEYGTDTVEGGAHSDTNLLVHLSADRRSAYVISIPRDSMTKAPKDCADPSSTVARGPVRQWNYNFNKGGPACTLKTLEGLTGVYVDHVAVIDFRGFQQMVDALGGVDVCLAKPLKDEDAHVDLPAGRQQLDGKEALGYVRARKSLGDGSDLARIKRQQAFMSSMAQEATRSSLLLRPDKLYSFLDAATTSITADEDLGLTRMYDIASSLKDLGIDELAFVTVPTEPYPADPDRVQWAKSADALWEAVREDRPLPGTKKKQAESKPLTVAPNRVDVDVVNDTTVEGLGSQEADALDRQGFRVKVSPLAATSQVTGVVVRHRKEDAEAARTLADAYPGARLRQDWRVPEGRVRLVLGAGAPHAREVANRLGTHPIPAATVTAPPPSGSVEVRAADEDICR